MAPTKPVRIVLADDHNLFRKGVQALLESRPDMVVVGEAADGTEAVRKVRELRPDVVLMDIHMPNTDGLEATRVLKRELPDTRMVMLTVSDEDADLLEAIRLGADGYLLKNVRPEQLFELVLGTVRGEAALSPTIVTRVLEELRKTHAEEPRVAAADSLTARERQILTLVAQGFSNKEIAARIVVTEGTVKNHLHKILDKLHVGNRAQASAIAIQEGLVAIDSSREAL